MEFESASLRSIARMNPRLLDEVREKIGIDTLSANAMGAERIALARQLGTPRPRALQAGLTEGAPTEHIAAICSGPAFQVGLTEGAPGGAPRLSNAQFEAIVLAVIRPPLLVQNGTFVPPIDPVPEVKKIVAGLKRSLIDPVIARTARVDLLNVPGIPYVGTAWVVEKKSPTKAIMVTNRHVAEEFASADGRGDYTFRLLPNYRDYQVDVDFVREYASNKERRAPVPRVVFIAGSGAPDIALIEVEGDELAGIEAIELSGAKPKPGAPIAVVGYPAYDSRSDPEDVAAYFGRIFDVKRFSFGEITGYQESPSEFTHDATTLGGHSGSCVFDRETGKAVGLHFAGDYRRANYAVGVAEVAAALKGLVSRSVVPSHALTTEARGDGRNPPEHYKHRDGFCPEFLGSGHAIHPPGPGVKWEKDLATIIDVDTNAATHELKYRHFSVWICASRKLPLMTAVNINGEETKRLGRIDKWYIDGRLADEFQVDNAAYLHNPLDRGHMVRREDPVWGPVPVANEANRDTFHYTNAAPQHEGLNQRDWVNLEDYILSNARTSGLKVSVFTGPVFSDDDPLYRKIVRLPRAFWKIAAVVNSDTKQLSVTGYLLCQGDLIKGLTGEFVYGPFRTYQVEVARIGELAHIVVAHLAAHDPLAKARQSEGLEASRASFRAINAGSDLVL